MNEQTVDDDSALHRRVLLEVVPTMLSYWDRDQRCRFANRACRQGFRVSQDDLLGSRLQDLLGPDAYAIHAPYIQEALKGVAQSFEQLLSLPGRGPRHCRVDYIPDLVQGRVPGILAQLTEVASRQQTEGKLLEAHAALQRLLDARDRVQEDERKRIARELHDDLQQTLSSIRMELGGALECTATDPIAARALMTRACELAAQALDATRRIVGELRPSMLEDLGLTAALEAMAAEVSRRTGVQCQFQLDDAAIESLPMAPAVVTCLYRVTQEALNNVVKHARAGVVRIELARAAAGQLALVIADDGCGMAPIGQRRADAYGLLGMAERVRAVGGTLQIVSAPGSGTRIDVRVPWRAPES